MKRPRWCAMIHTHTLDIIFSSIPWLQPTEKTGCASTQAAARTPTQSSRPTVSWWWCSHSSTYAHNTSLRLSGVNYCKFLSTLWPLLFKRIWKSEHRCVDNLKITQNIECVQEKYMISGVWIHYDMLSAHRNCSSGSNCCCCFAHSAVQRLLLLLLINSC